LCILIELRYIYGNKGAAMENAVWALIVTMTLVVIFEEDWEEVKRWYKQNKRWREMTKHLRRKR